MPIVCGLLSIAFGGASADAAFIVDSFPENSALDGNGITIAGTADTLTVTDTGVASTSILGGTRTTTLTLEEDTDKSNTGVNLKISGGSSQLANTSDNNTANGLFNLFYDGVAGVPAFPLDFSASSAGVTVGVHTHTNPGSNFPTEFKVTLFDSANRTAFATYSLADGVSGGLTLTFGTLLNPFTPQPSFDFSVVKAIGVLVDPKAGTNLILREIGTTAELSTQVVASPEPSTGLLMLLGAAGYAGKRRLARRKLAA